MQTTKQQHKLAHMVLNVQNAFEVYVAFDPGMTVIHCTLSLKLENATSP